MVETTAAKLIVEIKAANEISDPIVQAKARAASKWVGYANAHATETAGKEWRYVLVPHDAVSPSATLSGLVARYQTRSERIPGVTFVGNSSIAWHYQSIIDNSCIVTDHNPRCK